MPSVLQSLFFGYGLRVPVEKLPVWIDVQPTGRLTVLIALDVARLPFPLVSCAFVRERGMERRVVPPIRLGDRLQRDGYRREFTFRPLLLFGGLFRCCSSWCAPWVGGLPALGMVGPPPWVVAPAGAATCRYFIRSESFIKRFSNVTEHSACALLKSCAT